MGIVYIDRLSLLLLLLSLYPVNLGMGVIVDGSKKKEISATKEQHSGKSAVDPFSTNTCGMYDANFDEHEFINMAREGQFPWIVSFQIKVPKSASNEKKAKLASAKFNGTKSELGTPGDSEDLHFCAGSIIGYKWILSAAHCFAPDPIRKYLETGRLKAVAGSHKVSSRASNNQNLTIERIFYHSDYDKNMPIGFDVAIIELRHSIQISEKREKRAGEQSAPFINAICLPLKGKRYAFNETARVAGWGMSKEKDISSMPSKLLTTDILLSKVEDCAEKYSQALKSDRPKQQLKKYNDFLCAGFKTTRDACQSDSGGPLMQYADNRAVVIGIVSYGIGCATKGVPGIYTRTSAYINWIKDITNRGKDSSVAFRLIEAKPASNDADRGKATGLKLRATTAPPALEHHSTSTQGMSISSPELIDRKTEEEDSDEGSGFKYFDE